MHFDSRMLWKYVSSCYRRGCRWQDVYRDHPYLYADRLAHRMFCAAGYCYHQED